MQRNARVPGLILALLLPAGLVAAGELKGTVKLGAISLDEEAGDLSAIQETANIYEGFAVSQVKLAGRLGAAGTFDLDVQEVNLDSRRGLLTWRVDDLAQVTARYDRRRQLFDADGAATTKRENWRLGARLTPAQWLRLTGDFSRQTRQGDRLAYPVQSGGRTLTLVDHTLSTGRMEAEVRGGGRSVAFGYELSRFADDRLPAAERQGDVLSVRASLPCLLLPGKVSHFVRGSYGRQRLVQPELDYTMSTLQYVGVVRPSRPLQADYRLYLSRIDHDATGLRTLQTRNDFGLTWFHSFGQLFGGYGYVTNDDDRTLTSDNAWRVGAVLRDGKAISAKVSYASSEKTDTENLTLLKDITSSRLRISMDANPSDRVSFGVSYVDHDREFPVLGVKAEGQRYTTSGRYAVPDWATFSVDYTYADDVYQDQGPGFAADNHAVSGRFELQRIRNLELAAGLTYLDIGKDLDIEKSILMFSGQYHLQEDTFVEVKYNVYNYDDYVLLDRYYTANVVWVNVGYKLSVD